MGELFDKQSECIKRELEEKFPEFTQAPATPRKVCNANETKKTKMMCT